MQPSAGKRADTRRRTRATLRRAAQELFYERGFDAVTTSEIAERAGVVPATLFNHFDTKEDLFFGQVRQLERELVELVENTPPGASILRALEGHVLYELTAGRHQTDPSSVAPFHAQVAQSARLQAREHEIYDRRERVLAEALKRRTAGRGHQLQARVAARMYVAAEQLVADQLREQFGTVDTERALRDINRFIRSVFAILEAGIGPLDAR